ncbi:MAG: hypothetical protein AB8B80_10195 [Marinicellaceae bacterium]
MNKSSYKICLGDWESVLPKVSQIIIAEYHTGTYNKAEEDFSNNDLEEGHWRLIGQSGCTLDVIFEKFEGYFYGTLKGKGEVYKATKKLLYQAYIDQGGASSAQEKP